MEIKVFEDHEALSSAAADEVIATLKRKSSSLWCMASGETPRRTCQLLVKKIMEQEIDLSNAFFIGLDEWIGIPPTNTGSCRYFFDAELFKPLGLKATQFHLFDGMSEDLASQCRMMDEVIASRGGIDMMLVGIGMNGHIGFNEPGVDFNNRSHVAQLEEITSTVGQKYFEGSMKLEKGITLGFRHLLDAKEVILLANGKKKAGVVRDAVEGDVSNMVPASVMQTHPNGKVWVDGEAALQISRGKLRTEESD